MYIDTIYAALKQGNLFSSVYTKYLLSCMVAFCGLLHITFDFCGNDPNKISCFRKTQVNVWLQ